MEEKSKREELIRVLKLGIEQEYNVPNKPEFAKDIDRKEVNKKIKTLIDNYCKQNQASFEDICEHILKSINESRGVNPRCKDEYDLLEEILDYISSQDKEETR